MNREVDARGLPCPRPVVETKKALDEIEAGTVTVLVDNSESRDNIARFAGSRGCRIEIREDNGIFHLTLVKEAGSENREEKESTIVVLITSDVFGTGDERLGEILIKAFLNTLWDADTRPAKLLFMNSAVNLTTEGSEVLETLKLLEKEGVRVFSCGTCLEYYSLREKLSVGSVTNMYDTVDSLLSADKIIKL
jgi:selenium metabolism protein YedF